MQSLIDNKYHILFGLLLTASLGANVFLFLSKTELESTSQNLSTELDTLKAELASSTIAYKVATDTIAELTDEVADLEDDKDELRDELRDEKNKNDDFEDQIKDIAGTVGVLDKLSKTDKELLQKYSKVYFLNENYIPEKLAQIPTKYVQEGKDAMFFHADALPFLEDLLKDAARDDIELEVVSAYRSFDHQEALKGQYTTTYGSGANTFSADQGYSEHQLATTFDITTPSVGGTYLSFADTEAYKWMLNNAYKHGFILSYPEGNDYYIFEPWHWRFVGEELADYLHDEDMSFYDMEQRKIDEYLISIFD